MTTVHVDSPHHDLRRARAAAFNLIPISTVATRAPVPVGSIVDLIVELARDVEPSEIDEAVRQAAANPQLAGILLYAEDPLVSSDIVHSRYSCIFDSELTMSSGPLVKVFGWYDNEWGYSCRLVDIVDRVL